MGTRTRCAVAALALTGIAAISRPQSHDPDLEIQLGGIPLQLGMPQDDVLRKLAVVYDLRHVDAAPGLWTIQRKGGPPYRMLGMVSFRGDKLMSVQKDWSAGSDDQSARGLARALHDAVRALTADGPRLCVASVQAFSDGSATRTVLQCGRRELSVLAPRDEDVNANVTETLSSDQTPWSR